MEIIETKTDIFFKLEKIDLKKTDWRTFLEGIKMFPRADREYRPVEMDGRDNENKWWRVSKRHRKAFFDFKRQIIDAALSSDAWAEYAGLCHFHLILPTNSGIILPII